MFEVVRWVSGVSTLAMPRTVGRLLGYGHIAISKYITAIIIVSGRWGSAMRSRPLERVSLSNWGCTAISKTVSDIPKILACSLAIDSLSLGRTGVEPGASPVSVGSHHLVRLWNDASCLGKIVE